MDTNTYRHEFKFSGKDRKSINTYVWDDVENIRGVVQIFHGMSEHAFRYEHFALFLNKNGFVVFANDHRGHGKTANGIKELGVIGKDGFNMIVEDEYFLYQIIREKYPVTPVIVLGHSFGSFVAQRYITRFGDEISGAILSGSALQKGIDITLGRIVASVQRKIFGEDKKSNLLNKLSFASYNKKIPDVKQKFAWLSSDEKEVMIYENDPLCGGVASIGFFYYMLKAFKNLYSTKKLANIPITLPVYILSGEEDPVGSYGKKVQSLYKLYRQYGIKDIKIKLYRGMRHEILNEKNRAKVYDDILNWLIAHV